MALLAAGLACGPVLRVSTPPLRDAGGVVQPWPLLIRGLVEDTLVSQAGEWMRSLGVDPAVRLEPVDDRLFFVQGRKGKRDVFVTARPIGRGGSLRIQRRA